MCARIVVSVRTSWNVCKSLRTLYTHAHARIAAHQFLQLGRRCVSVCVVATAARKRHQCIGGRELVFSKFIAEWHTYILDGFFFSLLVRLLLLSLTVAGAGGAGAAAAAAVSSINGKKWFIFLILVSVNVCMFVWNDVFCLSLSQTVVTSRTSVCVRDGPIERVCSNHRTVYRRRRRQAGTA